MSEQIINIIISVFPSVVTIFSVVGVIIKVLKEFAALKKQVTDMKAVEDIRNRLDDVLKENIALKKTLNETMTKIDHIERK